MSHCPVCFPLQLHSISSDVEMVQHMQTSIWIYCMQELLPNVCYLNVFSHLEFVPKIINITNERFYRIMLSVDKNTTLLFWHLKKNVDEQLIKWHGKYDWRSRYLCETNFITVSLSLHYKNLIFHTIFKSRKYGKAISLVTYIGI